MADQPLTKAKLSTFQAAKAWGENPLPSTVLATLLTGLHMRPPQLVPLLFPPVLLLATYINLSGYPTEAAGITAAWSGLYLLMARRRKQSLRQKWGPRGIVRGGAMGLCVVNLVGGGLAYGLGRREKEEGEGVV